MKLNLALVSALDISSITKIEIEVSGKETLGWLLVKITMLYNLTTTRKEFFRDFKVATNCYNLFNGPNLANANNLNKLILELFSDESRIYCRESAGFLYSPENPNNQDEIVRHEYARVQPFIDNPIAPNTLKNITLGFIKAYIKLYPFKMDNVLPETLMDDFNNASDDIGNVIALK